MWNDGLKALKQQTSYSSVHLKQANLLLNRHSQDMGAGRTQRSSLLPLGFSFLYFPFPPFGCPLCKIGLIPTTGQWKGMGMSICSRLIDNCKLYNSRLCCLCLPTIQSVIIKCIYIPLLPLEMRPDSPGEYGMQPQIPVAYGEEH